MTRSRSSLASSLRLLVIIMLAAFAAISPVSLPWMGILNSLARRVSKDLSGQRANV